MRFARLPLALLCCFLGLLLFSTSCGRQSIADESKPIVVATIFNYYDALRAIAGDDAQAVILLTPRTSPHGYSATAKDKTTVSHAKLLVRNGLGLDDWAKSLATDNPRLVQLAIGYSILALENEDEEQDEIDINELIVELINPEIKSVEGERSCSEGCLSLPGVYGIVKRPEIVVVQAQDRDGTLFEIKVNEMTARAVCHEIDHLNGILFTSLVERFLTEEELAEMREQRAQDLETSD